MLTIGTAANIGAPGSGSPGPRNRDSSSGGGSRSASQARRTSGEIIEEEDEDEIEEVDTFSPVAPGAEETVWEEQRLPGEEGRGSEEGGHGRKT